MLIRRFASSARFAAGSSRCARLLIACVLACGLALAERAHAQARTDETLVHDPGVGYFVNQWNGVHHYWSGTVKITNGAVFVGNGKPLSRVGIYFTNSGNGGQPNHGSITQWKWRVLFYETLADFQNNPANPQVNILLNGNGNPAPTNPDWQEVLFQMDVDGDLYDVRYAEVDLNELDIEIVTTPGQYQVATLTVQATNGVGIPYIPVISSSSVGEPNWQHAISDVFPMSNWVAPYEYGATLITTKQVDTEPPCEPAADLNCDGVVNVSDLLILLGAWGACTEPDACPADLNNDGVVNVSDLLMLLSNWG